MMSVRIGKLLAVAVLAIVPLGCEPAPVVVNPDGDGDTTVIEDRDGVVPDSTVPPPDSETDVNVDLGGGEGVDVDVSDGDAADPN
jgi:hypothetical protein